MSPPSSVPVVVGPGPLGIDTLIEVAVHGREASVDAGSLILALDGIPQSGQGQHGNHRQPCPLDVDIKAVYQAVAAGFLGQAVETEA
jgi:hypothetical protein